MNKRITFITHGSKQLGMGHVMRCCSLAETFRQSGWEVFFISKFYLGGNFIKQKGFSVEILEKEEPQERCEEFQFGEEKELEPDMAWMSPFLLEQNPDVIFLDSYNVNSNFFKKLKSFTKCLVYLDDLAAWDYQVDIILNPNVDAEEKGYTHFHNQKKYLLGSKYNLLREEFSNLPKREAKKEIENILITTGAADPKNMTRVFLELCQSVCPKAVCHLIIGNAFQRQEEWKKEKSHNVRIYQSPKAMSEIMLQCDIAISAGGSTLYELAACGIPTLAFLYSENQRGVVEYLSQKEYLSNIGDCKGFSERDTNTLEHFTTQWSKMVSQEKRQMIMKKQQNLFDGAGTQRVVKEIEEFLEM
ncbi:MAG: UDP-2,4-diacetamido-2,4,6-trideoxy-beta-L-altropyranose hydrolase [Lachnospiraceae bacterium]|nr:UDP-2,4-diacetamido-2,4,6-trideoxy-beta-L-altropyranose hydrolase [Lachnospiraceae bacterium]